MKGEDQQEVKGCEGAGKKKKRWCNSEHGVVKLKKALLLDTVLNITTYNGL